MITIARIVSAVEAEDDENLLREVAKNFIVGNPLLHSDKIAPLEVRFDNFALNRLYAETEGINCLELEQQNLVVLGNPPWEKLRFEERAFFRPVCPAISAISQKNKREKEIKKLAVNWLELLEYYQLLQDDYASVKKEIPKHPLLKVSLVGELNTYAMFAELASRLTEKDGFAAIIVKSALVTSTCYSSCFRHFVNQGSLSEVFLFDNREKLFQIDSREKFCVLFFGGEHAGGIKVHYGLTKQEQILSSVPINVTSEELELINPETGLLPNVADSKEFSFLLRTHRSLSVFAKEFPKCHFGRLVHLTAHAEHISTKSEKTRVPIYEGKFIEQYDNRFSTFAGMSADERYQAKASARRQPGDSFVAPKPAPECRYFIDKKFWESFLDRYDQPYSLCWRSLTSPTIRFIEDRYKVIEVLKTIVFDYAGYANERDHVQKIVEQHYWLFGEQYHLVTADKRMQKALEEYLYLLYGDKAPNPVLTPDEEELRRMDIFACAARNTEDANGSAIQENLVVELKAPKVVLTKAVLRQIEDYMDYVRKQPLFNSQYRRWKFIAVCSAVDDDVKARYDSQKSKGKKGLVAEIDNYEVYALTWDDVFQSFDLRHAFLLDKLKMDKEAIAAEIAQTAGDEKSKDTADALTALVAN